MCVWSTFPRARMVDRFPRWTVFLHYGHCPTLLAPGSLDVPIPFFVHANATRGAAFSDIGKDYASSTHFTSGDDWIVLLKGPTVAHCHFLGTTFHTQSTVHWFFTTGLAGSAPDVMYSYA